MKWKALGFSDRWIVLFRKMEDSLDFNKIADTEFNPNLDGEGEG